MLHEIVVMKDRLNNAAKIQEELEKKNSAAEQKCDELKQALEVQFMIKIPSSVIHTNLLWHIESFYKN